VTVNLSGLGLSDIGLNIKARPEGGVHLWFSRGLEMAVVYSRERGASLTQRSYGTRTSV
jgi:hypothetical protein